MRRGFAVSIGSSPPAQAGWPELFDAAGRRGLDRIQPSGPNRLAESLRHREDRFRFIKQRVWHRSPSKSELDDPESGHMFEGHPLGLRTLCSAPPPLDPMQAPSNLRRRMQPAHCLAGPFQVAPNIDPESITLVRVRRCLLFDDAPISMRDDARLNHRCLHRLRGPHVSIGFEWCWSIFGASVRWPARQ